LIIAWHRSYPASVPVAEKQSRFSLVATF
jgi:hypothetical protein